MKRIILITLLLTTAYIAQLSAQTPTLPHHRTQDEMRQMPSYLAERTEPAKSLTEAPPPGPVRTMGEWEEIQALIITWRSYPAVLTEIVRHAVNECKVFIISQNPAQVEGALTLSNIPLDSVVFVQAPSNSVWVRDYGPWAVYLNDTDSLAIADWIYNRPRPLDDAVPAAIAEHLNLPIYEATAQPFALVHTGGNHLVDGMGTAFSSDLLLEENSGQSERYIDSVAHTFLGVNQYVKFRKLPYDGIHHLDMHMRVIDEETILMGQYPEGIADGPQIEANIEYLRRNFTTPFGNNYRIERLPMPPGTTGLYPDNGGVYRTFTNSVFVNKTIIVPIYDPQYDTVALRVYRENLPGYNIQGIDCDGMISALGAIHCITKSVGVHDPLWIAHPRLRDTYVTGGEYPVQAIIKHRSGIASATLYYRTAEGEPYTSLPMTLSAEADSYIAAIPAQAAGTTVHYYIEATAVSGKVQRRPIVAPEGYFPFEVKAFAEAPIAAALYPQGVFCPEGVVQFRDDSRHGVTSYQWLFPGGQPESAVEANPAVIYANPGAYTATLITQNPIGADTATFEVVVAEPILPYEETFSATPTPWTVDNPDGDGAAWALSDEGNCEGGSFMIDNFNTNTSFTRDYFRTTFDLREMETAQLLFDVAYAPYDGNNYDGLRVNVRRCDGSHKALYNKSNMDLATVPTPVSSAFSPSGCEQWRQEQVDLSDFVGEIITIEFENIGGYGNRLFVDNIELGGATVPNIAPEVAVTNPLDGAFIEASVLPILTLQATAADPDGEVTGVAFWVNGVEVGIDSEAPYEWTYSVPSYGVFNIEARANDNDGAQSISATVQITVNQVSGIDNPAGQMPLTVYPNPTGGEISLRFSAPEAGTAQCFLHDALGRLVLTTALSLTVGEQSHRIDTGELPAGCYWLSLQSGTRQAGVKVVKR